MIEADSQLDMKYGPSKRLKLTSALLFDTAMCYNIFMPDVTYTHRYGFYLRDSYLNPELSWQTRLEYAFKAHYFVEAHKWYTTHKEGLNWRDNGVCSGTHQAQSQERETT